MNPTTKVVAVAASATAICAVAWPAPQAVAAGTDECETVAVWAEPDPGREIAQRKAWAVHDFTAYAAARAAHVARAPAAPRPCAKFPQICASSARP